MKLTHLENSQPKHTHLTPFYSHTVKEIKLFKKKQGQLSILCQMPAGPGLLSSVGLSNTEDISQSWQAGLQVELGRLGQVCLFTKVIQLEQGGASLYLRLH